MKNHSKNTTSRLADSPIEHSGLVRHLTLINGFESNLVTHDLWSPTANCIERTILGKTANRTRTRRRTSKRFCCYGWRGRCSRVPRGWWWLGTRPIEEKFHGRGYTERTATKTWNQWVLRERWNVSLLILNGRTNTSIWIGFTSHRHQTGYFYLHVEGALQRFTCRQIQY